MDVRYLMTTVILILIYTVLWRFRQFSFLFRDISVIWFLAINGIFGSVVWIAVTCLIYLKSTPLSISSTLYLVFINLRANFNGKKALSRFRKSCSNVKDTQERLLEEIIAKNKDTEYGRKLNLFRIGSLNDLKKYHPLTVYEHYADFVKRVADGELSIMTKDPPNNFCITSGTTGTYKIIPQDSKKLLPRIRAVIRGVSLESFPQLTIMQRVMRLYFHTEIKYSKCGIPMGFATAIEPKVMKYCVSYTTPPAGLLISDVSAAIYIHLLFGIKEKSLGVIEATFIGAFEETIRVLMGKWQLLVDDLRNGSISATIHLEENIRKELTSALGKGDPLRAGEIEQETQKGPIGIVKRIWPSIGYIGCIDNTGRKSYLEETVAKGVTIYSYGYGSSEGSQGVNLWPKCPNVTFLPYFELAVFEFIPESQMDKESPETRLLHDLTVGHQYEIVVTQTCGFYRYRMGDVVEVVGYYGECPRLKFLYRASMLLNINNEHVNQAIVSDVLKEVVENWPHVELRHFCVAESTLATDQLIKRGDIDDRLCYIFFMDVRMKSNVHKLEISQMTGLSKLIDDGIASRHELFRSDIKCKLINPSKAFLVNCEAFWNLRQHIINVSECSAGQMKLPEKLKTREMVDIMFSHVLCEV